MPSFSTKRVGRVELSGQFLRQPDTAIPTLFANFIPFRIDHRPQITNADQTVCFEGEVFEYWGFSELFDEVEEQFDDPNFTPEKYVFVFSREVGSDEVKIQECIKHTDYIAKMNTQYLKNSMRDDCSSINQCG